MVTAMVESTYEMLESLDKVVLTRGGGSVEMEMHKWMVDVAADLISRTAFGGSYERGNEVFEKLHQLMKVMAANIHFFSIPILRFLTSPPPHIFQIYLVPLQYFHITRNFGQFATFGNMC